MPTYFPKYRKSNRWPYNPPQEPKFYRRFDVGLKIGLSILVIVVTYLIFRPGINNEEGYMWWVLSVVGCIFLFAIISRLLPPFLYGYVMVNKRYWKIDQELDEMQQYIDQISEDGLKKDNPSGNNKEAVKSEAFTKEEEHTNIQQDSEDNHLAPAIDYEAMSESNRIKNVSSKLEAFMATVAVERKAMEERRKKEDAEKLEKILAYTRRIFLEFDFTDEELFQLNECVTLFCTERAVLSSPNIKIYKKERLKQADIKNFVWNVGNAYQYPIMLMAQFVCSTFPAWFGNTEQSTVARTMKTTRGAVNIEIDPDLLKHLS